MSVPEAGLSLGMGGASARCTGAQNEQESVQGGTAKLDSLPAKGMSGDKLEMGRLTRMAFESLSHEETKAE